LRLDLRTMLPRFAIVDTAKENDARRAREVCAGIREGEIVLFDKAYVDFAHLFDLLQRGVWWVTRAKDNMKYRVVKKRLRKPAGKILRDDEILLKVAKTRASYPQTLRRVVALVEVEGLEREMVFLTNNMEWAPGTVADLYRFRWQIEVLLLRAASRRSPLRGSLRLAVSLRSAQADQADAAAGGLSGQQRQRRALAVVDGAAGVCAAALPGMGQPVGAQFSASVGGDPGRALEQTRFAGAAQKLWDSRRLVSMFGAAPAGVFTGPGALELWDSRFHDW